MGDADRRRFLKIATGAIGGVIGAVITYPIIRYVLFPAGRRVVTSSAEPIDAIADKAIVAGAPPKRVQLLARSTRDAWTTTRDSPVGAAWVRRTESGELQVFSASCPHLGCAVGYDARSNTYQCPCHKSAFGLDGQKLDAGPAKRGLDQLPWTVDADGRVRITMVHFRTDVPEREPV
jgi:menaquinol-cytochrome c reductase iron-sulfur subunit